ncbi:hypothetical protein C2134_02835 [Chromobacterium sinusclupearum]|uniref:Uncharacterized protein n=1 Tax=Chromobacterium sinusclupearum TaxID=2077146 RepID=A0A2K4MST4_9NEIS|nr:hypothetical protein [Chromobacterium sinusclupearum]POB00144.1 hypothetical protein C2134_02835 [Chromobacterium sinusclupearum]
MSKKASKLADKLSKRLTPETDQQPLIRATSWQVFWQYDLASDDMECVGVVMRIGDKLYWNLPSADMLAAWPEAERQILTSQLDALAYRLTTGALSTPMGMSLRNERESAGNTITEILTYLWRHGPALTLRKKKAHLPHDEEVGFSSEHDQVIHSQRGEALIPPTPDAASKQS